MRIDDAPDFARRGYMLDVSRCKVPAMQELKRTVDSLSAFSGQDAAFLKGLALILVTRNK